MTHQSLFDRLGPEIIDPDEETFLLFSQAIPSQNLGFVDPRASTLDLSIAGNDYVIHQSPAILNRPGSTTGAVVWKITPLVAGWLAMPENLLRVSGILSPSSSVLELGCGISGLVGLVLAPFVARYTLTDQTYVSRLVEKNIEENVVVGGSKTSKPTATQKRRVRSSSIQPHMNLRFAPLDWELDEVTSSLTGTKNVKSFDVVIACDCIYNDALILPLVQTCADACKLRSADEGGPHRPAVCLVAQQLRDPEIFDAWVKEFSKPFHLWRVPEHVLSAELRSNPGFVVHLGILRNAGGEIGNP
ncbi:hypothetical protein GGS23DRAFT_38446 [Durotheca rogersii]|uniref:uncharacterized protein n=1 Tax=Durotheca rogersii TaxID=419775 RepID=UPI00221E6604|nr:uncharacterized protein GGS23DRAFT_38446 [Durotheca rogersii]KAI5868590.1 hypothetical protein GGS23DRAFT_38446 [Durotheca rogersii]